MTNYLLPEDLGRAIALYLSQRPHGEVRRLVEGIEALVPVETEIPKAE